MLNVENKIEHDVGKTLHRFKNWKSGECAEEGLERGTDGIVDV